MRRSCSEISRALSVDRVSHRNSRLCTRGIRLAVRRARRVYENPVTKPLSLALRRLWSVVPSGGSLPENVWRSRHRFLMGLTWFHAAIIALAGPVLGYRWELSLAAVRDHETVLHAVA